ncbi:MAG: hypothetical protein ABI614_11835 [Planctomycetota bacterium]
MKSIEFNPITGELQQALRPRLSHDCFDANEALLRLSLLAFNLVSMETADKVRGGERKSIFFVEIVG